MKIIITGDYTTKNRGLKAVLGGTAFSGEVISLLKSSDLSIVNLECPVATDDTCKIPKVGPHLKTSVESIEYLKNNGVNLVTLANNHFFDYGEYGVMSTIAGLKNYGLDYIGGGTNTEEIRRHYRFTKDECTISILNYCESEFSVNDNCGSNAMNSIRVYRDIIDAKKESDHVLVITHGGHERYNLPSPRMKELYHFFIDVGASVVVNHHQHCYGGYENYGEGMIFYGLGNFFFDGGPNISNDWNEGFILELELNKSTNISYWLHPYNQCKKDNVYVGLMGDDEKELFYKQILSLNEIIKNDIELLEKFYDFVKEQQNNYLMWFSPYSSRFCQALCRRNLLPTFLSKKKKLQILNMLRCESHRDICMDLLNY